MQDQGGLKVLAAEIHMAFGGRQEEIYVHYDIIPATAHNNRLVSGNSKLTSVNSREPSFAADYWIVILVI